MLRGTVKPFTNPEPDDEETLTLDVDTFDEIDKPIQEERKSEESEEPKESSPNFEKKSDDIMKRFQIRNDSKINKEEDVFECPLHMPHHTSLDDLVKNLELKPEKRVTNITMARYMGETHLNYIRLFFMEEGKPPFFIELSPKDCKVIPIDKLTYA